MGGELLKKLEMAVLFAFWYDPKMRDFVLLLVHLLVTLARLTRPGGIRSVVAESVLIKQQLLIMNRSRQRSPNLLGSDRIVAGLCALLIRPSRSLLQELTWVFIRFPQAL